MCSTMKMAIIAIYMLHILLIFCTYVNIFVSYLLAKLVLNDTLLSLSI